MSHHIETRGPQVAGVAAGFLAVSWICMVLRIYTRAILVKAFGADDYLALISQLFFTAFCSFALIGVHYGTGKHAVDIAPPDLIQGLKWWWMCEPMYVVGNALLKISIGIFLLRITSTQWHRMTLYATVIGSTILSTWFFFMFVFQCYPSQYFWTQYIGGKGSCMNTQILVVSNYVFCSLECLADWIYFALPCVIVWQLQMNVKTKVYAAVLLGICGIASIATIIRFLYLPDFNNRADFLWATTDVAIWALAENGLGSCATSMATLRPLFRNYFSSVKGSSSSYPISDNTSSAGYKSRISRKSSPPSTKWKDTGADTELALIPDSSMKVSTTIKSNSGELKDIDLHEKDSRGRMRYKRESSQSSLINPEEQGGVWTRTTVVSSEE